MVKKALKIISWSFLWLLLFWTFLIIGFPANTAKSWLIDRLEKGLSARVSVDDLHLGWNLGVRLKGISIASRQSAVSGQEPSAVESGSSPKGFTVQLSSLKIKPGLFSLMRLKPEFDFNGDTPSGGDFSGSYISEQLSLSLKDISFKDISISALPVPSATTASGSGKMKLIKGKGMIEIEIDGIPGGKQRTRVPGGENPGLEGKFKVTVSLPKL